MPSTLGSFAGLLLRVLAQLEARPMGVPSGSTLFVGIGVATTRASITAALIHAGAAQLTGSMAPEQARSS